MMWDLPEIAIAAPFIVSQTTCLAHTFAWVELEVDFKQLIDLKVSVPIIHSFIV